MTNRPSTRFASPIVAGAIFVVALMVYVATLNGDVQPADSGELQLAAITLTIPHPPGYPLFTLLGWLFSLAPIGSPFARVSFLSAAASAATLVLVYASVRAIAGPRWYSVVGGALAAFALGTSTTFWAQATTTNIRSLTSLLTAFMVFAAVNVFQQAQPVSEHRRWAWLFVIALGLGVGHHASLAFVGLVLSALVLARVARDKPSAKQLAALALGAIGLLMATQVGWLLLPIRNAAPSPLAHGDLATLSGFADHALARGFGGDLFYFVRAEPERLLDRLLLTPQLLTFQFSAPLVVLVALSWAMLIARRRAFGATLLLAFGLHLFVTLTYRAPQTVEYALPSWVILAVAFGAGLAEFGVWLRQQVGRFARVATIALALMFGAAAIIVVRDSTARRPSFAQLASDRRTRADAQAALDSVGPRGVVLSQWHQAAPMWALQVVEGVSPTVGVAYVFPGGDEKYEDTFAKRARAALDAGHDVAATTIFQPQFGALGVCDDAAGSVVRRLSRCPLTTTLGAPLAQFDGRIEVFAPDRDATTISAVGDAFTQRIGWRARDVRPGDSLTLRFSRPDGRVAFNADVRLDASVNSGKLNLNLLTLAAPLDIAPGDYALQLGAYHATEAGATPYRASDGAEFVRVGTLRVAPSSLPAPTTRQLAQPRARASSQPQLVGVDYDLGIAGKMRVYTHWLLGQSAGRVTLLNDAGAVLAERTLDSADAFDECERCHVSLAFDVAPQNDLQLQVGDGARVRLPNPSPGERYVPFAGGLALVGASESRAGPTLNVDLDWLAGRAITSDYKVSARVAGNGLFRQHDGTPALGAIPTLKWIRGSRVTDRHPLDIGAPAGTLRGDVKVYDNFTQLPVPVLDERYEQTQTPLFAVTSAESR